MVSTNGIVHRYQGLKPLVFPDIEIAKGESQLILGNSGSGKTTLLHILGGLLTPTEGEIILENQNLTLLKGRSLDRFRGTHIGFIFQRHHLISALNVEENLLLAQRMAGRTQNRSSISQVLSRLNLREKSKSRVSQLSQGQAQRVAIARALINEPSVILADEPTSSLDDKNAELAISLIKELARTANASLVITTHDKRVGDHFQNRIEL